MTSAALGSVVTGEEGAVLVLERPTSAGLVCEDLVWCGGPVNVVELGGLPPLKNSAVILPHSLAER